MPKIIAALVCLLSLVSCAGAPYKTVVHEQSGNYDVILSKIKTDVDPLQVGPEGSVTFEIRTSIYNNQKDTGYFLIIDIITLGEFELTRACTLTVAIGDEWASFDCTRADTIPEKRFLIRERVPSRVIQSVTGSETNFRPDHRRGPQCTYDIYYGVSAEFMIDRHFLDLLFDESYCEFELLNNTKPISGVIDVLNNPDFVDYYRDAI